MSRWPDDDAPEPIDPVDAFADEWRAALAHCSPSMLQREAQQARPKRATPPTDPTPPHPTPHQGTP